MTVNNIVCTFLYIILQVYQKQFINHGCNLYRLISLENKVQALEIII